MVSILFVTLYDEFALGIRSMASYLDQFGHETHLCFFKEFKVNNAPYLLKSPRNYQTIHSASEQGMFTYAGYDANPWTEDEERILFQLVQEIHPEIICISIRNFIDENICDLFSRVRRIFPEATYIAGGFGPTFAPDKYLDIFDYVVRGEGEGTIHEIAEAVDHKQLNKIKTFRNISFKNNGTYFHNPLRPLVDDLDCLPFPKLSTDGNCYFIDQSQIYYNERAMTYSLLVGRGCPNSCSYCCAGEWQKIYQSSGLQCKPYRQRTLARVIQEVRRAGERGFKFLNIADSFLTISLSQQRLLFDEIRKQKMRFSVQFHPELALREPEIVQYAYASGLRTTVIGIQHGSERFSSTVYNRKNSNTRILQWARLVSSFPDVEAQYHFITGNPLETELDFKEHLDFLRTLRDDPLIRINELSFNILKLFPNTSLTKRLQEQGLQQSLKDVIYKSCLSILCLMLNDKDFSTIYRDDYYKEEPLYLIPRVYETQMKNYKSTIIRDTNPSQIVFDLATRKIDDIVLSENIQSITRDEDGSLEIISNGSDPWLLLQNLPLQPNRRYSCQWALRVPKRNIKTQLFYIPIGICEHFLEEYSAVFVQNSDICFNKIILDMIEPKLRLDVGDVAGTYSLLYLIIRRID